MRAFLGVDMTSTFCEGGGLPVTGGNACCEANATYLAENADRYDVIYLSEDWHVRKYHENTGIHWVPDGAEADSSVPTFSVHGEAGTDEARIHPALQQLLAGRPDIAAKVRFVRKGMRTAAFSMFQGVVVDDLTILDPTGCGPTLVEDMQNAGVTAADATGIATNHCVHDSVVDGVAAGFPVRVLRDLCVGIPYTPTAEEDAFTSMQAAGAEVTTTKAPTA